jgi:quinoprotein glucose dehydrogenase
MNRFCWFVLAVALVTGCGCSRKPNQDRWREWRVYSGGPDSIHYSSLTQINRSNVKQLQIAWTFDAGDASPGSEME